MPAHLTLKSRSKYKNVPVMVDGHRFASKKEAKRYGELKLLEKAYAIFDLQLQRSFDLEVNGQLVCRYRSDFDYWADGKHVVEDTKGFRTDMFRLKKKLMKACHNIEIVEL